MLARELEQSIDINATRREQLTDQIRTSTNSTVDRLEATLSSERTKLKNLLLEKRLNSDVKNFDRTFP